MITVSDFLHATRSAFTGSIQAAGKTVGSITIKADMDTAAVSWEDHNGRVYVKLHMPRMPAQARLTRQEADALTGYWLHELGHCLYSTPGGMKAAHNEGGQRLAHVLNALEDPRMEKAVIDGGNFPNAARLFHQLAGRILLKSARNGWKPSSKPNVPFTIAILCRGLACGYPIPQLADHYQAAPAPIKEMIDIATDAIKAATCEQDLMPAARAIVALMDQDKDQDDGQDGQDGQPSDGAGYGDLNSPEPDAGEVARDVNDRNDPITLEDDLANTLAGCDGAIIPLEDFTGTSEQAYRGTGRKRYANLKGAISNPAKLKRDVAAMVHSPDLFWRDCGQEAGRLDPAALARGMAGERAIFTDRRMEPGEDALVWLLVDLSDSMRTDGWPKGSRADSASTLAIHLGEAIESNAGRVAICGFFLASRSPAGFGPARDYNVVYRSNLAMLKAENQPMRSRTGQIADVKNISRSGTPLAHAIMLASRAMSKVPATRRVLIALTDGQDGTRELGIKAAAKEARTHGVDLAGILIDGYRVDGWPAAQVVRDLDDLTRTGLDTLIKTLRR